MTLDEALAELGIDHDAGSDGARRAYLRLLKTRKPETDPEGFMRLRTAYELVKSDLPFFEAFRAREPAEPKAAIEPVEVAVEPIEVAKIEVEPVKVEVEPLEVEVPAADPVIVPPSEDADAPVHRGDIALMEALLARSAYQKAATQALLILAGATNRLDQPDPPVLSCLRLMLGLHRVAEPTKAREVSAAFTTWLAATGQESTRIRGHAAVLWTLVRELDGMKKGLPDGVRTAIAHAALAGDLAEAKPDLARFRGKQPVAAEAAGGILRRKAPVIAAALADALDPPRPVGVLFGRAARPARDDGSKKGYWFIPMVAIGLLRILFAVGRSTTPTTYAPSYADPPPAYEKPSEWPSMTDDAGEMDPEMRVALRRKASLRGNTLWASVPSYSPLRPLFGAAIAALDEDDCVKLIAALKDIGAERTRTQATITSARDSMIVLFAIDVARYCGSSRTAVGDRADAGGDAGAGDAGRHGKTLK